MRVLFILFFSVSFLFVQAQKNGRKVSLEKTNKEEYKAKLETLKKDPNETKIAKIDVNESDTTKKVSAFEKSSRRERKKMDNSVASKSTATVLQGTKTDSAKASISAAVPANTSAIAHGEARTPSAAVAKTYKYKADEKSVEYYNELRKKFEEESKIQKEKDAQLALEKSKKEEELKQGRRLNENQAPQFDRYRQGEKNPEVKKTTAEEDYNSIFK